MGICWTRARLIGRMMMGRNAQALNINQQSVRRGRPPRPDSCGDSDRSALHSPEDDYSMDISEEPLIPERMSPLSWFFSKLRNNSSQETERKLEGALKETKNQIDELMSIRAAQDDHIRSLTNDLDMASRYNQEIRAANDTEVQRLKLNIAEKVKDLEAEKIHTSHFETKCKKLKTQLAMIEQEAARESRTSGSYSDDHANPGMLEGACEAVDKATENLTRFLHNNSVTKVLPFESPELKQFVRLISPANPEEFSRPIQAKYAWSYWICRQMFEGFEHVFFDADGGLLTSPLDSKSHALECFRRFQQKHNGFSSDLFEAFCSRKFKSVFPSWLVNQAISRTGITCDENGRFQGDGALHAQFMVVARAVWSLHQLAFSFDPPASILRMAREMPYDHQYHESVVHVEGGPGMSSQMVSLMVRPAFRVRKSVIRGRVLLCHNPNSPTQA